MLQQRRGLPVLWIVALKPFDERRHQRAIQVRVLAIRFLASSPPQVAVKIGIRRAYDQSTAMVLLALKNIARLVALDGRRLLHHVGVPGFSQPNLFWKRSGGNRNIL